VRLTKKKSGASWKFAEPKTRKGRRSIPIPESLVPQLQQHRRKQARRRLRKGADWVDYDLVFPGLRGQPLDWHNLSQRTFKEIVVSAKLPDGFTPYSLRHTCATLLLAAGEPTKVIAERLGHSTTAVTEDVYSHVLPGMQERATERLESTLWG